MKTAIFGGTFNPIHYGHLRIAEEVGEGLGLDRVVFIPAFTPPHKPDEHAIDPLKRLEMARLAIRDNPAFEVSDMEIRRAGVSYTIDTINEFRRSAPGEALSLMLGDDSWNAIRTWCDYETILTLVNVIVVPRPGFVAKAPGEALPVELARKFWYDTGDEGYRSSFNTTLTYFDSTLMDISSSDIRERVRQGKSIRYLMPDPVIEYISMHGLYK